VTQEQSPKAEPEKPQAEPGKPTHQWGRRIRYDSVTGEPTAPEISRMMAAREGPEDGLPIEATFQRVWP